LAAAGAVGALITAFEFHATRANRRVLPASPPHWRARSSLRAGSS
jgi:hypothetical protein